MRVTRRILSALLTIIIVISPVTWLCGNVEASETEESFWRSMASDVYYKQFTDVEKELYDKFDDLCMGYLLSEETIPKMYIRIDSMNISEESVKKVLRLFRYSNPQYFFLASSYGVNQYYAALYADPDFESGSARAAARDKIKTTVKSYLNAVSSYSRPEEKEHKIVELMSDNIVYVSGAAYNQCLYSAVLGKTVCAGYTAMFTALMNACGIECASICGSSHAWNIVNLHGFWFYVDVTGADTDQDWGPYYRYYNCKDPYGTPEDFMKPYLPDVLYDGLESDYDYSSRYITSGGIVYFIVNDIASTGRKVYRVGGSGTSVPSKITYDKKDYSVLCSPFNGWCSYDGEWFYYTTSGDMLTGWQEIGNKWYYFDSDGVMVTGWRASGDDWYCFGESGAMITGWMNDGNDWYYFDDSGAMVTGWLMTGGKWYYFGSSGAMKTGWYQSGGKWYFSDNSGAMVTGWIKSGNKWYYMASDGSMVTGWCKVGSDWYYFGSSGAMKTGWYQSGSSWYYFDNSGAMVTGSKKINGTTYKFRDSGEWVA